MASPGPGASSARWAVVGAGSGQGPDEFETRALVFISQQEEDARPLLREFLALRSVAGAPQARAAVDLAGQVAALASVEGSESFARRLHLAFQAHGVDRCEEWWEGREWRLLRIPMVECVLNYVLSMCEMLTEERSDFLRKVAVARTWSRVDRRFEELGCPPLREPDEEWQLQLNDWQVLLRPYPWNRVRSQVMSQVLSHANLREPLTQHVRLVRSYEFLRCLGGTLLDGEAKRPQQVAMLRQHGLQYGCWKDSEVGDEALSSYLSNVISVSEAQGGGDMEGRREIVAQLGFTPRAVRGSRVPAAILAHLTRRLLASVGSELREFCETKGLRSTLQTNEVLLDRVREILDQQRGSGHEHPELAEPLREFLLAVAADYLERTRSTGPTRTVNFSLLASGDPRMETLRALEEQAEARRLLDDMALNELQDLLLLIQDAYQMVHGAGEIHPVLEVWSTRLGRPSDGSPGAEGLASLHPAEIGELSAALQDFLQQNRRALKLGEEDALLYCVVRALGKVGPSIAGEQSSESCALSHFAKPAQSAPRRVVACFGAGEASRDSRTRSPVVVRSVPLGLGGPGEDYEVRELGIRIGGMYRAIPQGRAGEESIMGDVAVVHYEWVPPGEVREDSKPLQQILSSATHVRVLLPEGIGMEEREVDLQTNRVSGDSAWYRAIPSRPRTSADEHGGFRRLILEVGRGLRLPLPNGLLQVPPGGGVIETADVLAHILALWFSQKHARSDMTAALRQRPALLYFASTALFECFDGLASSFMEALHRHWSSVLGMQGEVAPGQPLTMIQQESQEILLELLTARPDGRLCAVLPPAHLSEFCALAEKTRHSTEFLAVERFCFESALEKISAFQDSTITFIIIDITGQISALQLGDLVRHARGAIRLIFNWYHGLIPSLAVTRSVTNVIVPPSIEGDMSTQVAPSIYRETFAVGQATLYSSRMMAANPLAITPLLNLQLNPTGEPSRIPGATSAGHDHLVDWARNFHNVQQHLREAHTWAQEEERWRCSLAPDVAPQLNQVLLLLVSSDEVLVRRHFEALPEGAAVQCFDLHATDRQALTQVEALLDRTAMGGAGPPKAGAGTVGTGALGARTTIVLFGVGFIAPSKLEDIVARAYLGGQRVVLCVQEPIGALRSVRVTTRHATEYVKAKVLWVSTVPALPSTGANGGVAGLRALRLVLGPSAIASERHTTLCTALEAEDVATCVEILQPVLKPEVVADLVAGVMHTLTPGSRAGSADPRALAYAIGCLATSFVLRANSLGLDQTIWDVSFPDFRSYAPICRFLDQVSAMEAWCRYLDLVGSDADGGGLSPRLPEGPIRWPRKEPTRHFLLSQWAPVSNTHSVGIEDMLEHAVPRDSLSDPQTEAQASVMYFGTGPGHHSEAHEEVLERHSLQRRELDWAQFSESWRTALDIKPDVFLQLAAYGVDTLRLFLCLPPERAIELGLTHLLDSAGHGGTPQASLVTTVAQKLLNDVECTGPLLETVVKEGAGEVAARLAAVKWLLLSVLPEKDALAMLSGVGRIDEATVEQLVQAKVMLCPRGREELLRRVVAIVVGLDGGDVLGTQHEIRRYLLETKTLLPDLLCDQSAKVGRAIVSFMFSPDHTEQLKRLEVGRAVTEGFEQMFGYNVLRWKLPESGEAANAEPHRITAAAHAAVLERAPGAEVAHALATGPLLTAVSHLVVSEGPKNADAFLSAVLDKLPMSADTLVLAVLETLAGTELPASDVMAMLEAPPCKGPLRSASNPFLPELFAALRARSLANYLALVAAHTPGDLGRPLQLALDGSPSLLTMYVEHFRTVTGSAPEEATLHIHNTMLDDASCAALFRYFVEEGDSGEERPEDLFLLWYCWGRSPDRQLPFWALPQAQGSSFTKAVNGGPTPFVERCRPIGPGLSVLAKYLIAPECLPLSVYNTMAHQAPWVHSEQGSTIDVVTLLLGQEDCEEYPPYTHRWHARALPSALKEKLLRRCHEDVMPLRDVKQHHFYPRVSEGVSETTLRFNLGLLMALSQDNEDLPTYFDHGSDSQRQFVAACIMCWCKSAGLEFHDLRSCVKPNGCERFERLWREFNESFQKEGPLSLRRMYVRGPLPPNMDVRWVEGNQVDVPIFARTRDSALLTAQWLNMLIMHFRLRDMAPFTPEDLVRVSGARGGSLQAGPRLEGALEGISRAVGSALRRDLEQDERARKLVRPVAAGKYDSMELVVKIAVLTDFVALLRSTPGSVSKCFQAMASAMAAEDGPRPSDVQFGALFDGFFSLQTVDTMNEGMEIEELVCAYHRSNLPLSTQSIEEIRWLHENFFGTRNKSTQAVEPKLRAFVSVCERLQRIRSLPLRTVAYQRRNERMVTCADVLREGAVEPPYLKQLHFRLMCERPAGTGALGAVHTGAVSEDVPGSLEGNFSTAHDEEFFAITGEEGGAPRGGGGMHRQWDRPEAAEAAWPDLSPVISAPEIVEIDASPSYYLHAVLRVRPGLQPILWRMDRTEGFYRLSGLLGQQKHREGEICKAFATNADAWQYLDRAQSAVVACDGFYLRQADDGTTWVVVFPVSRPPEEQPPSIGELTLRSRRYCIWPLCHSHRLVNLGFNSDTLQVVKLLVWVAWNMVESEMGGSEADVLSKATVLSAATPIEIVEPLRNLSVLSNDVEHSASAQVMPEGDEQLVRKMRRLHRYQQYERHLAEVLLRIMTKMKAQQRDDLGGLIRSESQRRSATMRVPFVDAQGQELSNLGRVLQRLLVPIVSKAGIVGSPITTKAWTQLELVLEACYRGEQLSRERCFAKHMHITKVNFAKRGATTLRGIYQSQHEGRRAPTVQLFSDSEDEEERPPRLGERPHEPQGQGTEELPRCVQYFEARSDRTYVDTAMDRVPAGGTALFDEQVGFGRPVNSRHAVLTFYDEDLPLYFVSLNRERLKIQYSASEGMCLGYLVHKNVFAELLEDAKRVAGNAGGEDGLQMVRTLRIRLLPWIADVLRSPLPSETKTWILRCCERMGMVAVAPYQEANHVNLALIAYCLCRCCPSGTDAALFLRSVLMNAWHIPADVRTFIERKSDVYGLYVVRPGTLQKMQDLGLHVAVRDFEREVWQRSMNNSAMYLDIISHFSSYCCFCYVQGLPKIDDIVLKWLAEYTRLHPWRFIFLEGVDTSFNFPENRDRCNYRFAPPNPLHTVKTIEDLRSPFVAEIRPSHTIPYPERLQPSPEDIQDPRRLFSFFSREFAPAEGDEAGQGLFQRPPSSSHYSSDFRAELEHHLFSPEPCLVLLVSAPGAGKTHHMGALRGRLEGEMQFDIHEFDGSSDILVTTALAEVLQRTISTQSKSGQKLLILDEYHMLSDEHKDELFEWVRAKLGPTLRVVLIGNRIDSKDRQRLEQSRPLAGGPQVRVGLIQTRLSRQRIEQVMGARGNSEKWRDAVCDWLVGSRLVFGEESVSLRLCDTLEQALQRPDPRLTLVELLLHRVPTISRPTATEFVSAYLQHVGLRSQGSGPAAGLVGLCFRISMLDRQHDELCSFVEFLERTPRAHEALPAVRLLAWCVYMMNARSHWDISLVALWGKCRMFVDQVNFPFELGEESAGGPCSFGPTFSWAGDPTSLRDLVDAVKRGHSVDWADVHRKVWAVEHIKDSELFAQLLSSSRNPAMILQQVMPANLCSLLRLSNTPAPTAVQLARIILRHAPFNCEGTVDRPRCLALWTLILHDRRLSEPLDVLRLVGGAQALMEALVWARDWATDHRVTVPPAARTRLLQQLLVLACVQDQLPMSNAQTALLWTGSFGRLLRAATPAQEELWARRLAQAGGGGLSAEFCARGEVPHMLPQAKFRLVIQRVADVQEDWSAEVQTLWRTAHNRTAAREVSALWSQAPHLLQDLSESRPGVALTALPVHEANIPGIVGAPGTLCRSLQRALLCNNCQVPEGVSPTAFVTACADALNEMRNADQLNLVRLSGPNGEVIHKRVKEEMAN